MVLGELYMDTEDYVKAEKYLNKSNEIYEKAGDKYAQLDPLSSLAILYLKKGEVEKAKGLIDKIYEYSIKTKSKLDIARAERLKGILFREQKNWEQSILHFEKSLQMYKSLNVQKWWLLRLAGLLYEYGLVYLERTREGDKEKAYSLLDEALKIYQKMDAKKKIEEIIAKKKLLTA